MSDPILAMVPREPSITMIKAAHRLRIRDVDTADLWRAMIAAYEADTTAALKIAPRPRAEAQRDIAVAALRAIAGFGTGVLLQQTVRETLARIAEIEKTAR